MKHSQSELATLNALGYQILMSVGLLGICPLNEEPTFNNTRVFTSLAELMDHAKRNPLVRQSPKTAGEYARRYERERRAHNQLMDIAAGYGD